MAFGHGQDLAGSWRGTMLIPVYGTLPIQYRFINGILFFPGYRLIRALRSKLVVELNRKDVCRGVEGPANNLEQWVIVRCPVDLGLVQE